MAAANPKEPVGKAKPTSSRVPKAKGAEAAPDEAPPATGSESTPEAGAEESKEDRIRREARALMAASEAAAAAEDLAHPLLRSMRTNAAENADIVLDKFFSDDGFFRLTYYQQNWYIYSGQLWTERDEQSINHYLDSSLRNCRMVTVDKKGNTSVDDFPLTSTNLNEVRNRIRDRVTISSELTAPLRKKGDAWQQIDARGQMVTRGEVVDMLTGETKSNKHLFIPNGAEWKYNPTAKPPVEWLKFLKSLKTSKENILLLQEWMGYLLSGDAWAHKGLILVGPKRAGKGVIGHVMSMLLGESMVLSPSLRSIGGTHGLQNFISKRLCLISDARLSLKQDIMAVIEMLLQIIGGDKVDVNPKNKPIITVRLGTRVMMLSNSLPAFVDDSDAIKSRFMIIRLTESFYGREDPDLIDRLFSELPSIALWSMDGYQRLRARGKFAEPQSSKDEREEWEADNNPVARFVRDYCVVRPEESVKSDVFFKNYSLWAKHDERLTHIRGKNQTIKDLYEHMKDKIHPGKDDTRTKRVVCGISIDKDAMRPIWASADEWPDDDEI